MNHTQSPSFAYGFSVFDLYRREGLLRLDRIFLEQLRAADSKLHADLIEARDRGAEVSRAEASELGIRIAPRLEDFIGKLFGIDAELALLKQRHTELEPLFRVKREFVQRQAAKKIKPQDASQFDGDALFAQLQRLLGGSFSEALFARKVSEWLLDETAHAQSLAVAQQYAAWAVHTTAGQHRHHDGLLFKIPGTVDPMNLVRTAQWQGSDGVAQLQIRAEHLRRRDGFGLTDAGFDLAGALDQAHYCIQCHPQKKDSCADGLKERPSKDAPRSVVYKKSAFGVTLSGCPLEERISEFHQLKTQGLPVGALAMITIDNPMAAGTGHRICNDCMKACIYQKQDAVNIPQVETRTLKDVLELPFGFEIYSLLTRWNPLNLARPYPRAATGRKVLVVGLGPAGYTLAHHLLNDGHTVVGIDGLKIEPLPEALAGVRPDGNRTAFEALRDVRSVAEPLDQRVLAGFGGVAEYGITVRWDKNNLKLIRLLLARREEFAMYGGVRFGGTIDLDDAVAMGFDHVALCMGAGKPTTLDVPNGLARGVRAASDFLMALQLTGAAKRDSIANLQLRLPVVVIGGGLTAIDAATESLAYYVVQVEKFLHRYEGLAQDVGEDEIRDRWDDLDREIAEEFLAHARALRAERELARRENRPARIAELLQHWGGAKIVYRRRLVDSPSYTLNHEEVEKALEEGITFLEALSPAGVEVDNFGAVKGVQFHRQRLGEDGKWSADGEQWISAHTVLVAAGTSPNTVLAREDAAHFALDGRYFAACDDEGRPVKPAYALAKPQSADVLLTRLPNGRFVSFFGDLHPSYFGNVVKAMASARQGYPRISRLLERMAPASSLSTREFFAALSRDLLATVHFVQRLTPTIVEIVVKAPAAARKFEPGQFYRLQNFESLSKVVADTRLHTEGLALTGAWVDAQQGLVSCIVLEMGGSSNLVAAMTPGEPVILMGPTGTPTEIVSKETVLLAGGGLGNAVLFSIGQALKAHGSRVLYFAGYKKVIDRYKIDEIEAAADVVVWCCDEEPGFVARRPQDRSFVGNIVQAMEAYATGRLGETAIRTEEADRIIAIGSDRMMAGVAKARHDVLRPHLKANHCAIGSINAPMQCMMKEICAQCLQLHHDARTGKSSVVFSCFNQDQPLDAVDFGSLNERLKQNALQEKLTAQWLSHCARQSA
ncbi:MAG TPA: FAD-dependent oxidoreductase [Burkholderiaceae bacterium]|nr:FAD-dependent oxidoreductase [Burkholderiaceae bacterium]